MQLLHLPPKDARLLQLPRRAARHQQAAPQLGGGRKAGGAHEAPHSQHALKVARIRVHLVGKEMWWGWWVRAAASQQGGERVQHGITCIPSQSIADVPSVPPGFRNHP